MLKKLSLILTLMLAMVFTISGCSKKESAPEVKTETEFKAEAQEQINEENMDEELNRLEKEIESDLSQPE